MSVKCVGVIHAEDLGFTIERTDGAYSSRVITIADGDYYLSGDGESDDLADAIDDAVNAFAELTSFTTTINSSGKVGFTVGATVTATITWTDATTRDLLGFSGASTNVSEFGILASSVHYGGLYITHGLIEDVPVDRYLRGVKRADDGTPFVDLYGSYKEHEVSLRVQGWYRKGGTGVYDVYNDFRDSHMMPGELFRLYPDASVSDPYDRSSAPYGYETWVYTGPDTARFESIVPGTYDELRVTWQLTAAE